MPEPFQFALTDTPIDPDHLRKNLTDHSAGALVTFEGWVRHRNLDRDVIRLEYEAADLMARNEFEILAREALEKFEITALSCTHRVGLLNIGDLAVWIGVTAEHRAAAFEACRFLIDELKQRVPIWKKEHYTDGDSGWINHP